MLLLTCLHVTYLTRRLPPNAHYAMHDYVYHTARGSSFIMHNIQGQRNITKRNELPSYSTSTNVSFIGQLTSQSIVDVRRSGSMTLEQKRELFTGFRNKHTDWNLPNHEFIHRRCEENTLLVDVSLGEAISYLSNRVVSR